jgi:hypothetical protein
MAMAMAARVTALIGAKIDELLAGFIGGTTAGS